MVERAGDKLDLARAHADIGAEQRVSDSAGPGLGVDDDLGTAGGAAGANGLAGMGGDVWQRGGIARGVAQGRDVGLAQVRIVAVGDDELVLDQRCDALELDIRHAGAERQGAGAELPGAVGGGIVLQAVVDADAKHGGGIEAFGCEEAGGAVGPGFELGVG